MSLFSIPPHAPFLPTLAAAVLDGRLLGDWPRTGPFWLSDVTIVLPTQRAKRVLAQAFLEHPHFNGLLPDIRTFGGEVEDEEPFLPPFEAAALPRPASVLHRRLVLSRLVAAWARTPAGSEAFSTPPTAAEIFSMADSLGLVFDDLAIEERDASALKIIAEQLSPTLGAYWQQTLTFLDIALTVWPQVLQDMGLADPAFLRGARLDRQANAAPLVYGDRPVIAAGSTGSIPATARLLRAISRLPRGALVLPGLDTAMSAETHAALLDPLKSPHGHPQYNLARLLRTLGAGPGQVVDLVEGRHPRTHLVTKALALTEETAGWYEARLDGTQLQTALKGMSVIAARHEDEEARAIALAARAALAEKKTVGIITPDRNLARRIAAELARFDIYVDDAAGAPLFHAPVGRLARQILNLAVSRCGAVDLIALLRSRWALFGYSRGDLGALTDAIELGLLRGQRMAPGLAGLRAALAAHVAEPPKHAARRLTTDDGTAISALFDRVEAAIAPLVALIDGQSMDAADLAQALRLALAATADGTSLRGRDEFESWADQMVGHRGEGHPFPPIALDRVLSALMTGFQVRNHAERRTDIAIWGQLEARLMSPDLVILGAVNEDKWPEPADPGPWLSRGMRLAAGLEPPERLQGLAAHDFAQAIGNSDVIVAYARRIGASPASPSRFLQRLDAFIGAEEADGLRDKGAIWLDQARALDGVPETRPAARPLPNPPVDLRPRRLSVTEIETLMRSPYDLYARHVLGLRRLDPLGDVPDARERGTIIHDALGRFVMEGHDPSAPDAFETLMSIAADSFSGLEAIGERRDIWLRRFETAARQFLEFERLRAPRVRKSHAEIRGEMTLPMVEPFLIAGQADRIDVMMDGSVEILDFKTGTPPTKGMMQAFEAPQLLVEALMAEAGAMKDIPPARTGALIYVKIALGPEAFVPSDFAPAEGMDLMEAAAEIGRRMQGHIDFFLFNQMPMPARLLPLVSQRFAGAHDHLSRLAEWTAVDGGEDSQ